jgi:exonuclease SbcC
MKILNIKFKNINNLKGENSISFKDEPLSSAGIFAITGPTGSGKSTLLDVITLALFNKIPRFKGSISKSSIEGLGSVVTHHMDEASASITYEIHNQVYTSEWSVGKTRTGNFKDYEMFIYDVTGKPLDLKKSEVPAKNEEIIGLKYDQFVKSIILSQGQFSKFLKADKHERGQLLENLTGSSIYRKISIAAYDKFKVVKDEVALEKDRLENIRVLTEEERNHLATQIKAKELEKNQVDIDIEKLTRSKQIKSEIDRLTSTLNIKKSEHEELVKDQDKYKDKLSLLDTYDNLSPILSELTRYKDANTNLEKLKLEISRDEDLVQVSKDSRQEVMSRMESLAKQKITVDNFSVVMSDFEKGINQMNQELHFILKSGKELRNKIENKAAAHSIEVHPKPDNTIPILNENIEVCNQIISNANLDLDANYDEVSSSSANLTEELKQLKEVQHAFSHVVESEKRFRIKTDDLKTFTAEVSKYEPVTKMLHELVLSTKERIALLDKQKQDARLIAKLTDHREHLIDGEPCPLCGSTDHPFAAHSPVENTEVTVQLNNAKEKLDKYEIDFKENNTRLTESLASKKLLSEQIKEYKRDLEKAIEERKSKINAYKGNATIKADDIDDLVANTEFKLANLNRAVTALQRRSILNDLVGEYEELSKILGSYSELERELKLKYSGEDVSKECNDLQDKFVAYNTQIAGLLKLINNNKKEQEQVEKFLDKTKTQLEPEVKKFGFDSITEATSFIISESELNQLKSKREALVKWGTTLETEMKTLNDNLSKQKALEVMPENKLIEIIQMLSEKNEQKEALMKSMGEHAALIQKDDQERLRIKQKEEELAKLQMRLDKWSLLNKLIGEKTGNKFANFAQGLTLQNLLVFANKRLQKLSDRYLLDKPIKDGALTVIDLYQGNIQRSVTTLSGGESFLISLALALSLSDMASKNVNLESLFIDEGFGTLDQESLDIAMDTLEKLQTESQKTVGVISHVEALKERIHVQIKLEKSAQGYGSLKIEG